LLIGKYSMSTVDFYRLAVNNRVKCYCGDIMQAIGALNNASVVIEYVI